MNLRKVIICCVLLVLASAVVIKSREVAGLREQARPIPVPVSALPFEATKSHVRAVRDTSRKTSTESNGESVLLSGTNTLAHYGDLSPEAIKQLNLSADEVEVLTEAIRGFRTEAMQDLSSRLKFIGGRHDDGTLRRHYHARARRDRGQAYFDSLALKFGPILGEDRSRSLIKGLTRDDLAAQTGQQDLEIELIRSEKGMVTVSHQFRSPSTGEVTAFHQTDLAEFEARFGKLFEEDEGE